MATRVLLSFDVEMSPGAHRRGVSVDENLDWFVFGCCRHGSFGLTHELRRLNEHGLNGVFFVDALCAEVFGLDVLKRMVQPILSLGHEVQLHVHTEWLDHAERNPVAPQRGPNIADFSLEAQVALIERARDKLIAAGAPPPTAFRAGNFGANDDTLRALARSGIRFDASFDPAWVGHTCRIDLPRTQIDPVEQHGVTEIPVSCILVGDATPRHAQLCALSRREMRDALEHAERCRQTLFCVVLHSVELISHRGHAANRIVIGRFEALLDFLASNRERFSTVNFAELAVADLTPAGTATMLPANALRSARRMAVQGLSNLLYEHIGRRRLPRRVPARPQGRPVTA